jgi:tRNA-dihydrouridine synthase B
LEERKGIVPSIPDNDRMKMRLGDHQFKNALFLAPMAGITDYPFRQLARRMGCDLVFTEMISAEGLLRKGERFLKMERGEHPVSVQLFGSNPDALADAAEKVEALGADVIDLNMGCPAKKVVKTGAGASLMRFPEKVKQILAGIRRRVKVPFTIKIRSGWDENHINAIEISRIAEDCGVDAISVHPRTREQGFHGLSDWNLIREVKQTVRIPVIGNGDVTSPSLVDKMKEETGCDGVMVGRGALGNPWIFENESSIPFREKQFISLKERQRMIDDHFRLILDYYGDSGAVREIRKHLYWYTKGLPSCASFHAKFTGLKDKGSLFEALDSYFDSIEGRILHGAGG